MEDRKPDLKEDIDFECHKGETCKYAPILCQEGYCSECWIYINNERD